MSRFKKCAYISGAFWEMRVRISERFREKVSSDNVERRKTI
jgi:hypothetical protein